MMKMATDTERKMKDSGIPWIGMIPEEWKIVRLKNLYSERTELSSDGSELLLSVSEYYGVAPTSEKTENDFITRAESLVGYKKCFKNDFVSNIMLAWKGSFGTTDYDGIISPAYCVYKPINDICPHYYHYLLRTDLFKCVFKQYSKGVIDSRLRLYSPYFLAIHTIYPPVEEQERIAGWLDEKCGDIDELIEVERKMIETLEAYRQATITEAVTGSTGILPVYDENGNRTRWKRVLHDMRQTNIHWAPLIPRHWTIKSIKQICYIMDYLREPVSADQRSRNNPIYPYYGASGIIDYIDFYNVDDTVLLIGEDGANLVMRNLPLVYKSSGKIWVNNHAHILKPKTDDYDFCAYVMEAADYFYYITGSAQPKLSQENIGRVVLPMPPIDEQRAIAEYLDAKCKEIDELIAVKREKIETLKQYRQSLIFEAVTGKIQVPHASSVDQVTHASCVENENKTRKMHVLQGTDTQDACATWKF